MTPRADPAVIIKARDNPRVRRWRRLVRDGRSRREEGRVVVEGAHLVSACLQSGTPIVALILSQSAAGRTEHAPMLRRAGVPAAILADAVFKAISDTESPAGVAAEIVLPAAAVDLGAAPSCVFLDGVQDAGNVGAILRSAAAFGIRHAVLGRGCADAWSPKVLRAGMGAHFAMCLVEQADLAAEAARFGGRLACTVPRGGTPLAEADLSGRIGWLLGAEGQGVSDVLAAAAQLRITIPMAGGMESLNVAAAAAICFYALSTCGARS
jgi:RNA methyltransferase, TrmH family